MSKVIWKFPFEIKDEFYLSIPSTFKILSVQMQGDQPCIWCLVDPESPKRRIPFCIFGTGHQYPSGYFGGKKFVGTFQLGAGVWHLFVEKT